MTNQTIRATPISLEKVDKTYMRLFALHSSRPLKYVSCGNLLSKQGFLHPRRILDTCVLILVKEGTLYITSEDVQYEVSANQYILLNAGEEHYGSAPSTGKLSYSWVHFCLPEKAASMAEDKRLAAFMQETKQTAGSDNNIYIIQEKGEISDAGKVPLLFFQLLNLSQQETYMDCIADYTLSLLVLEISQEFYDRHNNREQNIPPSVVKIMDWIRVNYDKPLTVASIAGEFDYHPDYLSTLFRRTTHTSLIYFINKTRIDVSKSLIINYDVSVREAAYSCGFSDEKYFMKTFKKLENLTPTQYRKAFSPKGARQISREEKSK